MFLRSQHIHFIGIGGIGMSGIAEILLNMGFPVSGSDLKRSATTERLAGMGATIFEGHAAGHVLGADVVVTTSALSSRNPEVAAARQLHVPIIQRAEMLAELMRLKYGVAVAGMHGKTTTTSMIAAVLAAGGLDPTVVVGGRVDAMGSNARLGKSEYLVAEADESDRSFLKLSPILAVVTNLDREHMDCYRDMGDVEDAFVEFMDKVPFYGASTVCIDDPMLATILPRVRRRVHTYGTSAAAEFRLQRLGTGDCPSRGRRADGTGQPGGEKGFAEFEVIHAGATLGPFTLHVPGAHNVLNATAAVSIGLQLGLSAEEIAAGLATFRGVDRRFQRKGEVGGVTVVDDYGHHPTEIRATLAAARECGFERILVLFQPHRYSRTRDLLEEFRDCFAAADQVWVLDIYAASEEPIAGIHSPALVEVMGAGMGSGRAQYAASFQEGAQAAAEMARAGDLILTLGAGNVQQAAPMVLEALGLAVQAASNQRG